VTRRVVGRAAFYAPLKPPDDPTPSGDRRVARLLLQALERAGLPPVVASRFRSRDAQGDPARQARMAALGPALARRAVRRIGAPRPRIWLTYHLYYKAADWFGPEAAAAMGTPYVVAEASYAPKRAGGPWDLAHRRVAEAVRQAAAVLCLNPNDAACLLPLVDDPARIVDFPPFLNVAPYRQAARRRGPTRAALAVTLDLPEDAVWLLAVGMMRAGDKAASYAALAAALGRLGADLPDWRLIVVGDGPARPAVEAGLQAAAPGRVAFVGALDEAALARYYAAADLMVWPAVNEAFGMALLEAQATGLAAVAGDVGGVSAVVARGESGMLTPAGDHAAFAAALDALIRDPDRRLAYGAAGARRVAARQSLEAASARLEALLETLDGP